METVFAQQYVISTIAGGAPPPVPGTNVSIGEPDGIHSAGNVYFARSATPEPLFGTSGAYAPASDGKHFVVAMPATGDSAQLPPLNVITHWQTGLKK